MVGPLASGRTIMALNVLNWIVLVLFVACWGFIAWRFVRWVYKLINGGKE